MSAYVWSTLTNGQVIAFDPDADTLQFDSLAIGAAAVGFDPTAPDSVFSFHGKTVTLSTPAATLTDGNVTFADGSKLLVGDNTTATGDDDTEYLLTGTSGNDQLVGLGGDDTLDGGGGSDSANFYGATGAATVNLASGVALDGRGGTDTLISIETVVGTAQADSLTGGDASHSISGNTRALAEFLNGRGGNDTVTGTADQLVFASYRNAGSGVTVALDYASTVSAADGEGGIDTLIHVAAVRGSMFNDSLTGGAGGLQFTNLAQREYYEGLAGNDTINGGTGEDEVVYYASPSGVTVNLGSGTASDGWGDTDALSGIERVSGSDWSDSLTGSNATGFVETFQGRGGDDTIKGAGGIDIASYLGDPSGVSASLLTNTVTDGYGDTDTLFNIEGLVGSYFDDSLTGSNDTGSASGEYFEGLAGHDIIDGGDGAFDRISYASAPQGVVVDMRDGSAQDGYGTNDSFSNIERVRGSNYNDLIFGNGEPSLLEGLAGNDTYVVGSAETVLEAAGGGIDTVQTEADYTLDAELENLTFTGSDNLNGTGNSLDNIITGNSGSNVLEGLAGADTLIGGAGDDFYDVDDASDIVTEFLNGGTDTVQANVTYTLSAEVENLLLTGVANTNGTGNLLDNDMAGNGGDNALDGGAGADTMSGSTGNDSYVVDDYGDEIVENVGEGNDTVSADIGYELGDNVENLVLLGAGDIDGSGNSRRNSLIGNAGSNVLDGGAGVDTLAGGLGDDVYVVSAGDVVVENASEGVDTVISRGSYTLGANLENLTIVGYGNYSGAGNTLGNLIIGNASRNQVLGLDGNDRISGKDGDDVLDGGAGADTMIGGDDDDSYSVDNASDVVKEGADAGMDTVLAGVTYTLSGNMENLVLTSSANIDGTGNVLDNTISGSSGNNVLDGGIGADAMLGGNGDDTYVVDNAGDAVTETASQGIDTVRAGISYALGAEVEKLSLMGSANIDGTGNSLDNAIKGNLGDNLLNGGAGADTLTGSSGNDIYVVDVGDTVVEAAAAAGGVDTVRADFSYSLATGVENLELLGSGNINGTGNSQNNLMYGNSGANQLAGGAGNDTLGGSGIGDILTGGAGNDTYLVDSAVVILENAGGGTDTVKAEGSYTLGANLENLILNAFAGGSGTGNSLNNVIGGNDGANQLTGGAGDDTMTGGAGADRLTGGDGNDSLDGGAGVDTMNGGAGNDVYVLDNVLDLVSETASGGVDTVQVAFSYTLAPGSAIENVTLTGLGAINGYGNGGDNVIVGNQGANTLHGGNGNGADTMNGGLAKDILIGGGGIDQFVFDSVLDGESNVDTIADFGLGGGGEKIVLDDAIFSSLHPGSLAVAQFIKGTDVTVAADANDFLIYNMTSGELFYDADGNGAAAAPVLFAVFTDHPGLSAGAFLVI